MEPVLRDDITSEDKLLFLFLLAQAPDHKICQIDSMKYVFFIKYEAHQNKRVLFRTRFKMYEKGPVSLNVYSVRDSLDASNFASYQTEYKYSKDAEYIQLHEEAYLILGWLEAFIQSNPEPFEFILSVMEKYGFFDITWEKRQEAIYALKVNDKYVGEYSKIYNEDFDFSYPPNWDIFTLSEEQKNEFDNFFDPKFYDQLIQDEKHYSILASGPSLEQNWST